MPTPGSPACRPETPARLPGFSAWAPLVVGAGLLLGTGAGYRVLARQLERGPERVLVPAGTLARLPQRLGPWVGQDTPVDTAVIRAADVDDFVNRRYVRQTDLCPVGVWIACGGRARDLMPHRPEVCYPGAGWTLLERADVEVSRPDGRRLPARRLVFAGSGLSPRRVTVLNFYLVDGETCADVSLLRSKAWRGQASIRYVVQVQIACEARPLGADATADAVQDFAAALFGPLQEILEQALAADSGQAEGVTP